MALRGLVEPRAGRAFKGHFPRRVGRLARRCAAPHASPAPPPARPSLPHRLAARTGVWWSTCPCCRRCFDAIQRLPRRLLAPFVPPRSPRRSAMSIAGVPASAHFGYHSLPALPFARPSTPPRPQPTCPCLLAGALFDHLAARAWRTTPAPGLRGRWARSSTSGGQLLRLAHPPHARRGERPSNLAPLPNCVAQ